MDQRTNPIVDEAKQAVGSLTEKAKERVEAEVNSTLHSGVSKATGGMEAVAGVLRGAGRTFRDVGNVPDYAERAADAIQGASAVLQDMTIGQVFTQVERFARREPALFLGSAFAVGLLGGRFLKSSAHREHLAEETDLPSMYGGVAGQGSSMSMTSEMSRGNGLRDREVYSNARYPGPTPRTQQPSRGTATHLGSSASSASPIAGPSAGSSSPIPASTAGSSVPTTGGQAARPPVPTTLAGGIKPTSNNGSGSGAV